MTERLQGRVCVVTGAASPLGRAVAARFAQEGGQVAGVDKIAHTVGALCVTADLADEGAVRDAFAQIWARWGRLDVLYTNNGLIDAADHSALELDAATWNRVLADNLTATWLSCKHAIPYMLRAPAPNGSVINTASFLAGMGAASAQMAFNVAKAGVEQLSRDLGVHLARRGVRVNALALGPIETPQLQATFARLGEAERRRRFTHMPMGRFGTVEELAGTAAYLASDDAGFVTASSFPLNGGIPHAFTTPEEAPASP